MTTILFPLIDAVVICGIILVLIRRLVRILVPLALLAVVAFVVHAAVATQADTARTDPPGQWFVADSGVFLDDPSSRHCRAAIDARYADDPTVTLVVHEAVLSEVGGVRDGNGTQTPRLSNGAGRTRIVPAATPPPPDADRMVSGSLGPVDILVLETALRFGMPVLTTNEKLARQVTADPQRPASRRYGGLVFVDACTGAPLR